MSEAKVKESAVASVLKKYCKSCKTINSLIGTSSQSSISSGLPKKKNKTSIVFDNIVEQYEVEVLLPDVAEASAGLLVASKKPYKVQCVSILRALDGTNNYDSKGNSKISSLNGENDNNESNRDTTSSINMKLGFYTQGWIIDASVPFCMSCNSQFSFFNRRHHCRKCGFLVCESCSMNRQPVPMISEGNSGSRVCISCTNLNVSSRNLNYSICEESPSGIRDANSTAATFKTDLTISQKLLIDTAALNSQSQVSIKEERNENEIGDRNQSDNNPEPLVVDNSAIIGVNDTSLANVVIESNISNATNNSEDIKPKAESGISSTLSSLISNTALDEKSATKPDVSQSAHTPDANSDARDDEHEEPLTPTTPSMKASNLNPKPRQSSLKDQTQLSSSLKQSSSSTSLPKGTIIKDIKAAGVWERDSPTSDISASPHPSPIQASTPKPQSHSNSTNVSSNPNDFKTPVSNAISKRKLKKKSVADSGDQSKVSGPSGMLVTPSGKSASIEETSTNGAALSDDFASSDLLQTVNQNGVWEDNDDTSTVASTVRTGQSATSTPFSEMSDASNNILSTAKQSGLWETDTDGASTVNTSNNSPMSEFSNSPL